MICQKCKESIDHTRGDMVAKLSCEGKHLTTMVFCLKCAMEFLDWVEPRGEE